MDWSTSTIWWITAGALVAAELASGTFYLLMLALGAAAAAIAAHLGLPFIGQLLAASLLGGGAVIGWHLKRRTAPRPLPASENRDVNLDIGEIVEVLAWGADGSTEVRYRGTNWSARYAGTGTPGAGPHRIHAIDGSRLLLEPSTLPL